ncbi:MAG: hypothetical protein ACI4KF_08820 [Huintestinicola sp.]
MMIKQNVNRILPATLALMLCLSLSACGGDSQSAESTKRTKTGIKITDFLGGVSNGGSGNVTRNENVVKETAGGISEYVGLWECVGEDAWLRIYEGEAWEFLNDQEVAIAFGSLWVDETGITLYFDDTGDVVMRLDRTESGELIDNENGGVFILVDGIRSSEPYFTRNGLAINAELDQGVFLLENGFASYEGDTGAGYTVGECYWEVTKNYDETRDGIREIKLEALCYVPQSSIGTFDGKPKISSYHQLYDFYTGKWFTRIDEYKTSSRGKDYYLHTVEWNGRSGIIEFTRSTDWENDVGDWAKVGTTHYHIFMPEWYDGLVLTLEPLPDSYEGFTEFDHRHYAYAEASIMDIDPLDPYGCLFFDICG